MLDAADRLAVLRKGRLAAVLLSLIHISVLFDSGCHPKAMTDRWDMGNRKRTPVALEESHFVVNALLAK